MLEHVLTVAWDKCQPNCSAYFTNLGITMNASTDMDFMTYHVTGLPKDLVKMIQYICFITDHPIMHAKALKDEKKAVKDEMLAFGAEPDSSLIEKFNHAFYKNGMQFKDDWQLQVANLNKLTLRDLQRVFRDEFNTGNVTFLVSGKFNKKEALGIFEKCLHEKPKREFVPLECFTYTHAVLFDLLTGSPTCTIYIGFPSKNKDQVLAAAVCEVLKNILFEELRTNRKLVYGVHLEPSYLPCGTQCVFEITAQTENVEKVVKVVLQTLNKYKRDLIDAKHLYSTKTFMQRNLHNTLPSTDTLAAQVAAKPGEKVLTREEAFQIIEKCSPATLRDKMNELFVVETALLAYQGPKDLHLTWEKLCCKFNRKSRRR